MTLEIELLVVPDCPNESVADELIAAAMAESGVEGSVTHTIVASQDQATSRGFTGSPTILLNGTDPFATVDAPVALACRLYPTQDGLRGTPGMTELSTAITAAAQEGAGAQPQNPV